VLLALGVREVAALVVVQRQTQFALVRAEVVFHEVRVLLKVDRLQRQLPQPLAPVAVRLRPRGHAAAPRLAPGPVLEVHLESTLKTAKISTPAFPHQNQQKIHFLEALIEENTFPRNLTLT